jgi:4-hydroxybenzoate polyprenyltransferase
LFVPAGWAVALVGGAQAGGLMLLMLLGAAITRAAGCIMNDLTDRRLDAQVARTRTRPLASGAMPVWLAVVLLLLLLVAALGIALLLPSHVFYLALVALPMMAAYPWMKRITWWPQVFLGLTFNLGVLFGWLATGAPLILATGMLYAAAICWTLGYDTIYAIADMDDDAKAGIRSSARRVGLTRVRMFVAGCYGVMLALLVATGALMAVGWPYYVGVGFAAAHALWQVRQLPCAPEKAGSLFASNRWLGLMVLMGLLLQRWV